MSAFMRAAFAACLSVILGQYAEPQRTAAADPAPRPVVEAVQERGTPERAPYDARSSVAEWRLHTVEPAPFPALPGGVGPLARVRILGADGDDCAVGTGAQSTLPPSRAPPTHS